MNYSTKLISFVITLSATTALLPQVLAQAAQGGAAQKQADSGRSAVSSQLGVFVYPKNKQDQARQAKDENECYNSAKQQSGIDPAAPADMPGKGAHRLLDVGIGTFGQVVTMEFIRGGGRAVLAGLHFVQIARQGSPLAKDRAEAA